MFNRNNGTSMYQMPVKDKQKNKEILSKIPQSESEKKFEKYIYLKMVKIFFKNA